jgi:hypothetical protein
MLAQHAMLGCEVNLEIKRGIPKPFKNADGVTFELSNGEIYLTDTEVIKLGGIIKDAATDFDETNAPLCQPLRDVDQFVFDKYRKLCECPSANNREALSPSVAMKLLNLSDYIGNEAAVNACKSWAFNNIHRMLASTSARHVNTLFHQRIQDLVLETPPALWADDLDHPANTSCVKSAQTALIANTELSATPTPSVNKPGFLKQLLIMAFPTLPLSNPAQDDRPIESIEGIYNHIVREYESGRLEHGALSFRLPDQDTTRLCSVEALHRSLETNATDAFSHLFTRDFCNEKSPDYDSSLSKYIKSICAESQNSRNQSQNSIIPMDAKHHFYNAVSKAINGHHNGRANLEVLSLYISTMQARWGARTVERILESEGTVGERLLYAAAKSNDLEVVKLLVDAGAPAHDENGRDTKAINVFSKVGNREAVQYLLDQGVSPDAEEALEIAIEHNRLDIVDCLVSAGATLSGNHYDSVDSPLNLAARFGRTEIFDRLLAAGCEINDVHVRNARIPTGKYHRNSNGHIEINERTLAAKAEKILVRLRESPLVTALSGGAVELATVLFNQGALLSDEGWAAHEAVDGDLVDGGDRCLKLLLKHYPNAFDKIGTEQAGKIIRDIAASGNEALLRSALELPALTTNEAKRSKGIAPGRERTGAPREITAYDIYRGKPQCQPELLAALKPQKRFSLFNRR